MDDTDQPKLNHFVYMGGITPYTIRQLILSKSEALIGIIEEEAQGGNWKAADALLRYAMPQPPQTFAFPMPNGSASFQDKVRAIIEAVASGKLPPADGSKLLDSLGRLAQVEAMQAIERQMEELKHESVASETIPAIDAAIEELRSIRDRSRDD